MQKTKKKPLNLTIHPKIRALAERLMAALGHADFSGLFEDLVRRAYEERVERIRVPETVSSQETDALNKGAVKAHDEGLQRDKRSKENQPGGVRRE